MIKRNHLPLIITSTCFFVITLLITINHTNSASGQLYTVKKKSPKPEVELIQMTVNRIAGQDGGLFKASTTGWIQIQLSNIAQEQIRIPLAADYGKHFELKTKPAYRIDEKTWYKGFETAEFTYQFIDQQNNIITTGHLEFGDNSYNLNPKQSVYWTRRIQAPPVPGKYSLKLTIDLTPVHKALSTYSSYFPHDPIFEEQPIIKSITKNIIIK
ncbi:hypothetical protein JD969_19510 [Planctomycetota bacterium]|nr:hypothetical protein JD969_19510 [Planctomycetota bacterium]